MTNGSASGERTRFDLSAIGRHGQVGNGRVLGLAGTMGDHGGISVSVGQIDGV